MVCRPDFLIFTDYIFTDYPRRWWSGSISISKCRNIWHILEVAQWVGTSWWVILNKKHAVVGGSGRNLLVKNKKFIYDIVPKIFLTFERCTWNIFTKWLKLITPVGMSGLRIVLVQSIDKSNYVMLFGTKDDSPADLDFVYFVPNLIKISFAAINNTGFKW